MPGDPRAGLLFDGLEEFTKLRMLDFAALSHVVLNPRPGWQDAISAFVMREAGNSDEWSEQATRAILLQLSSCSDMDQESRWLHCLCCICAGAAKRMERELLDFCMSRWRRIKVQLDENIDLSGRDPSNLTQLEFIVFELSALLDFIRLPETKDLLAEMHHAFKDSYIGFKLDMSLRFKEGRLDWSGS